MKRLLLTIAILLSFLSLARAEISKEKRDEIEKMMQLTGMEKLMDQMTTQLIGSLRLQIKEVPSAFWDKFKSKIDTHELIELIYPIYDKYYTVEDLKAVNAFYESSAGRKMLASLPQVMEEAMVAGQKWGKLVGEQAAKEAMEELKTKQNTKGKSEA